MSLMTNRFVIRLRSVGRTVKINRLVERFLSSRDYEHRYKSILLDACREGDCVWDVGANIGYYSRLFSEKVGLLGYVYAFEPSQTNRAMFANNDLATYGNVLLMSYALGDRQGDVMFRQGMDAMGATSKVIDADAFQDGGARPVKMVTASDLISSGEARFPNIIKIDVEGYELEVLRGFGNAVLNRAELRLLGIEVHFGILRSRGKPLVPAIIEAMVKEAGFECKWCDASHLVAIRV